MLVLRPEEQLLWYDRPPALREGVGPFLRSLFMLVWTLLALIVTIFAYREINTQSDPGIIVGVLLAGVGFSVFGIVVLSWSVWQFIAAWHTYYGITGKRIIILKTLWPGQVMSLHPHWLKTVTPFGQQKLLLIEGWRQLKGMPDKVRLHIHDDPQLLSDFIRETLSPDA